MRSARTPDGEFFQMFLRIIEWVTVNPAIVFAVAVMRVGAAHGSEKSGNECIG